MCRREWPEQCDCWDSTSTKEAEASQAIEERCKHGTISLRRPRWRKRLTLRLEREWCQRIRKYNSWALRTFHAWDYAGTVNDTKVCLSIVCLIFWHVTICWALPDLIRESLGTRLTMFWTPQLYIPLFIAFVLFFWFNCTCNCTFWLHAVFQSSIISEQFNNFQSGLLYCTVFSCMEIMVLSVPLIHPRIIQQKIVIDESHRLFFYPIQRWLGRGTGYTLLKDDQQQLLEDNSS